MFIYKKKNSEKTYYTNLSTYELEGMTTEASADLYLVENVFHNNFAYPKEIDEFTDDIFYDICRGNEDTYKEYFQSYPVSSIHIHKIIPTQRFLKYSKLQNMKQDYSDTFNLDGLLPEFVYFRGFYYLLDGHHRIATCIMNGQKNVFGKIIDLIKSY